MGVMMVSFLRWRCFVAAAVAALVWPPTRAVAGGIASGNLAPPEAAVRIVLVGPPGAVEAISVRVPELVGDLAPHGLDIERVQELRSEQILEVDRPGAHRLTAWVIVDGRVARVRAATAGRERIVSRDVGASIPLTELDAERVGQTLKVALVTVAEGGAGALPPAGAIAATAIAAPPAALRPALTEAPAATAVAEPRAGRAEERAAPSRTRWVELGALAAAVLTVTVTAVVFATRPDYSQPTFDSRTGP
jgi:hypothetical protein